MHVPYRQVFANKALFLKINFCIVGIWVLKFYSIQLSSAPLNLYAYFFMPLVLIEITGSKRGIILLLQAACVVLPFIFFVNLSYGYLLGLLSGLSGYAYLVLSKDVYSNTDLTPTQSLMVRFWGIIAVSGGAFFFNSNHIQAFINIDMRSLLEIILIGIGCFILQIWFSQNAIIQSGVVTQRFFSSVAPFTVYLAELFIYGHHNFLLMCFSILPPLFIFIRHIVNLRSAN